MRVTILVTSPAINRSNRSDRQQGLVSRVMSSSISLHWTFSSPSCSLSASSASAASSVSCCCGGCHCGCGCGCGCGSSLASARWPEKGRSTTVFLQAGLMSAGHARLSLMTSQSVHGQPPLFSWPLGGFWPLGSEVQLFWGFYMPKGGMCSPADICQAWGRGVAVRGLQAD